MNRTIMLSTVFVASVVAATVLAAPQVKVFGADGHSAPNRAEAYRIATGG